MARTNSVNFTGAHQYPLANAATDLFKKEDVQQLAAAHDGHDHTSGNGLPIPAGAIPNGLITSAMIADGTIQGTDIANGAITSVQIADGQVLAADIGVAQVTSTKLGPDVPRGVNLLVNGGFEIYDRGANTPTSVNGGVVCDRWNLSLNGTSTGTASLDSSQADLNSAVCAKVVYNAGSGGSSLYQQLGSEWVVARGKWVTLSARVRCSVVGGARISLGDGAAIASSSTNTQTGGMETLSVSFFNNGANPGCNIYLELLQTATFYWDNVMLVIGQNAPCDYLPLQQADEKARCLRYFERLTDSWLATGYAMQANVGEVFLPYYPKGGAPTITYGPAIGNLVWRIVGSPYALTSFSVTSPGIRGVLINGNTAVTMGANQPGITFGLAGGGYITAEWNP